MLRSVQWRLQRLQLPLRSQRPVRILLADTWAGLTTPTASQVEALWVAPMAMPSIVATQRLQVMHQLDQVQHWEVHGRIVQRLRRMERIPAF